MNLEDLHPGASVLSKDGHKLGTLGRFVLNKYSFKLTHLVIDTGILRSGEPLWKGGWLLSHDRVVPLGVLATIDHAGLHLTMSADEFKDLSIDYIQEHFEQIPDAKPGKLDLSDFTRLLRSIPGEPGPYVLIETRAEAPDEVEIQKGSPVWRLNPHEKLGEVHAVLVDEATSKIASLVVRRGFVLHEEVVLPMSYVTEVVGDIVRVEIDDVALSQLDEFHQHA